MAKTNFTKVEDSLRQGIDKLAIKKIVDSTDKKQTEKKSAEELRLNKKKVCIYLIAELKRLSKTDKGIYTKLGITLQNAKKLLENPTKLSDEDWSLVLKLKDKVEAYKRAFASTIKDESPEEFVQKERDKQANTRFNIQKEWLPID